MEEGRAIELVLDIYVYVQNKPAQDGGADLWSRGGVWFEWRGGEWEGRATSLVPRLLMPSRLRLSVINLIEALFLVDCGSKRKKQGGAAKKRNETEGSLAAVPLGSASECVRKARPTHARQVPSRVLKPYPLTLLVGADDRLSGSAARNSWPSPGAWCLVALSLYLCGLGLYPSGLRRREEKAVPPSPPPPLSGFPFGRSWLRGSAPAGPLQRILQGVGPVGAPKEKRIGTMFYVFSREPNEVF